jgi:hypothetical protein
VTSQYSNLSPVLVHISRQHAGHMAEDHGRSQVSQPIGCLDLRSTISGSLKDMLMGTLPMAGNIQNYSWFKSNYHLIVKMASKKRNELSLEVVRNKMTKEGETTDKHR